MLRNATVLRLPIAHVCECQGVVRIPGNLAMHVDYHERQQHFLRRNLIDRAKTLVEMRRRVDMGSPLPDMSELLHCETVFLDGVQRRHFLLTEALPVRRARPKRVREIDESLRRQGRVNIAQTCRWRGGA